MCPENDPTHPVSCRIVVGWVRLLWMQWDQFVQVCCTDHQRCSVGIGQYIGSIQQWQVLSRLRIRVIVCPLPPCPAREEALYCGALMYMYGTQNIQGWVLPTSIDSYDFFSDPFGTDQALGRWSGLSCLVLSWPGLACLGLSCLGVGWLAVREGKILQSELLAYITTRIYIIERTYPHLLQSPLGSTTGSGTEQAPVVHNHNHRRFLPCASFWVHVRASVG